MANAYPADIAEVKLFWSGTLGVQWTNTFHYRYTGAGAIDAGTLGSLAGGLASELTALVALLSTSTVLERLQLTDMSGVDGPPRTVFPGDRITAPLSISGAKTGDPLPTQVAFEALVKSTSALRRANGRMWISGVSESDQTTTGRPDGPATAAMETALNDLLSGAAVTDWEGVIVSYKFTSAVPIIATDVQPNWRTQRRRVA